MTRRAVAGAIMVTAVVGVIASFAGVVGSHRGQKHRSAPGSAVAQSHAKPRTGARSLRELLVLMRHAKSTPTGSSDTPPTGRAGLLDTSEVAVYAHPYGSYNVSSAVRRHRSSTRVSGTVTSEGFISIYNPAHRTPVNYDLAVATDRGAGGWTYPKVCTSVATSVSGKWSGTCTVVWDLDHDWHSTYGPFRTAVSWRKAGTTTWSYPLVTHASSF